MSLDLQKLARETAKPMMDSLRRCNLRGTQEEWEKVWNDLVTIILSALERVQQEAMDSLICTRCVKHRAVPILHFDELGQCECPICYIESQRGEPDNAAQEDLTP